MKTAKLIPLQKEHRANTPITIDMATNIDLGGGAASPPCLLWVAYKARRRGPTSIFVPFAPPPAAAAGVQNTPGVKRDTYANLSGAPQTFTPTLPGFYIPFLVAQINNKAVTYRGVPIRVVRHA